MIEPNRLSRPGERAARERVEDVFALADQLGQEDLQLAAVPRRDVEERVILLAELERIADRHGRGTLLDEARGRLRDALMARAASRWPSETGVTGQRTWGRAEDQVEILLALEDAVSVAVAEDLLDPDAAAILANPGRRLLGLAPLDGTPGLTSEAIPAWTPSAADWAAAARGGQAVDPDASPPGTRAMRLLFLGTVAVIGVPSAIAWGVVEGSPWLGALAAVTIVVLCWTFATWRTVR